MKFSKKLRAAILSSALVVSMIVAAVAVSAYDGTTDPIISLSYLRQYKVQEIDPQIQMLQNRIIALEEQVNTLSASGGNAGTQMPIVNTTGYAVVQLGYGQTLIAGESCEIILRSGTATVVLDPQSSGGISDLTGGEDLADGTDVTLNHLLLVPRDDGRGLYITSDIAFLMIRGAYSIE